MKKSFKQLMGSLVPGCSCSCILFLLFSFQHTIAQTVFNYTGSPQTYVVPSGCDSINIDMQGATGGNGYGGGTGGGGGRVQAKMAVIPGTLININVGSVGGSFAYVCCTVAIGGETNGGAAGYYCGGGGGASDLRIGGTALSNRVFVAGGGGGGGYDCINEFGGAGGGLTGGYGIYCDSSSTAYAGFGGTQSSGGADASTLTYGGGRLGAGSNGEYLYYGGAGGGGYYGGGGGCYGGGGGGSSYASSTASGVIHTQGYNTNGNGSISITQVLSCNAISGPFSVCVGATITFTDTIAGSWSSSNTAIATINSAGVISGIATGTDTISYYYSGTCGSGITKQVINVLDVPVVDSIIVTAPISIGTITTLRETTTGGTWGSSDTFRVSVSGSGVLTGVSAGADIISYSVTNICGTGFATKAVTVNPDTAARFSYTGSMQTYIVPSGCNSIYVDMQGGKGGDGYASGIGGAGGRVQVVLPIVPGTVVYIYTGGAGGDYSFSCCANAQGGAITGGVQGYYCGGGGGASDIRIGGISLSNRMIVAGGGGGGGYDCLNEYGGAGGGLTGGYGIYCLGYNSEYAGGGGTQTSGGSGATIGTGGNGSLGFGGNGEYFYYGGAGGGGYYGGGGGYYGGGGGGSSFINSSATVVIHTQGYNSTGNGVVFITALASGDAIYGPEAVCLGSAITLRDSTSGGTWHSSNTSIATVNSSGIVTGMSTGVDTISYTYSGSYGSVVARQIITVQAIPVVDSITSAGSIYVGAATQLGEDITGGTWHSSDTTVASVNISAIVAGVGIGNATITYSVTNSCGTSYKTLSLSVHSSVIDTLTYTGSIQTYVVPQGCTNIYVDMAGGTGGNGLSGGTGGAGGRVWATIPVVSGTTVFVYVAGAGGTYVYSCCSNAGGGVMLGGNAGYYAGGGGGASDIRIGGTSLSNRLMVAGGGGGGGYDCVNEFGGPGGGLTGGNGIYCYANSNVYAGQGGTQVAGGAGATVDTGGTGSPGKGGNGEYFYYGGGGGGGYYGGGGGYYGGGGGGSSYTVPWAQSVVHSRGYNSSGNGKVVIIAEMSCNSISGPSNVCVGSHITLSDSLSGGTWASSNHSLATISTTGIVTGLVAGIDTISYRATGACGTVTAKRILFVNKIPVVGTITGSLVCIGAVTTLSDTTLGGSWASATPSVATIDSSGHLSGITVGSSRITYTATNSCGSAYKTTTVTVKPLPGAISGSNVVCTGNITSLSDTSAGGTWTSGTTTIATVGSTGSVTGITSGTATITYTKTGCYVTQPVTINTNPLSANTGPTAVCVGNTITLANSTSGGTWSSSNTSFATVDGSGHIAGIAVGIPVISYMLSSGCYKNTSVTVNNTYPAAISGTFNVCTGNITPLTNATTGGTWASGTTTVATVGSTGSVTGITSGTATITYTKTGCYVTQPVTINTNPLSANTGPTAVCVGNTITLANSISGGTWSSSNTSFATVDGSGHIAGIAVGIPVISYMLSSGCYKNTSVIVNNTYPAAIGGTAEVCTGNITSLTDATTGGTWASGTTTVATVGSTGIVTGVSPGASSSLGIAIITYTKTGCYVTRPVTVNTNPLSANTGPTAVCVGNTITLANSTSGGTWSSSNTSFASVDGSGHVAGAALGAPMITYTLGSGCYKTSSVAVHNPPSAISGSGSICTSVHDTLTNATPGGTWTSSATTKATVGATTGIVTGYAAGTATITYSLAGCTVATHPVTVSVCRIGDIENKLASNTGEVVNTYSIYPNPSNGLINIVQSIPDDITSEVIVMNDLGQAVYKGTVAFSLGSSQLYLEKVVPGVYLIELKDAKGQKGNLRVVIEK